MACIRALVLALIAFLVTAVLTGEARRIGYGHNRGKCSGGPVTGRCKARLIRYYYNQVLELCLPFVYGGCGGSSNRYKTRADCKRSCASAHSPQLSRAKCSGGPVVGPCEAAIPSFYFDTEANECRPFTYGGCGGSANRYDSRVVCESTCVKGNTGTGVSKGKCSGGPVTGPCRARFIRYYYDSRSNQCRQFVYGGCRGSANRYISKSSCKRSCVTGHRGGDSAKCSGGFVVGPCNAIIPSYYFDSKTNQCRMFTYGGCEGSANRYDTKTQCESTCGTRNSDKCSGGPVVGPCEALIPSYYFDSNTRQCTFFNYGGCEGSPNRYSSKKLCEQSCL